ncbi:MAG: DNA alkylation repair protein [Rhodothermia bacterium]|nr:DNA alkylation repair protein [Rhodothermia bacterium]
MGEESTGYLEPLIASFEAHANPNNAEPMKRYMREQFEFLGIKAGPRRALFAAFVRANGMPERNELQSVSKRLWMLPYREYQYTGVDLLIRMRRQLGPPAWHLCEHLITTKSWWDTVDGLAGSVVGSLYKKYPEDGKKWIAIWQNSENLWLRRTAILFQLKYGDDTNWNLLRSISLENAGSDEFFIQKAIGWALRQYARVDAEAVIEFVGSSPLSALSKREALKRVSSDKIK